jgi:hypothetical protein
VAQARSRARERGDAPLRPLGLAFIAVVVIFTFRTHPAPGLHGAGLGVTIALAVYAAAVATAISVRWARRGQAAQAAASILIGGSGVALAVLQESSAMTRAGMPAPRTVRRSTSPDHQGRRPYAPNKLICVSPHPRSTQLPTARNRRSACLPSEAVNTHRCDRLP